MNIKQLVMFRSIMSYLSIVILLVIMLVEPTVPIVVGITVTILLIIYIQIIVVVNNRRLVDVFKQQLHHLELSLQRNQSMILHHPDAVFSLNLHGEFMTANPSGLALMKRSKEELIGKSLFASFPESTVNLIKYYFEQTKLGLPQSVEVSFQKTEEQSLHLQVTYIPSFVDGNISGVFCIVKDNTENKENQERINYLAFHDSLTGLANRRSIENMIEKAVARANQNKQKVAVMFFDLDHFKIINDTLGHSFGDKLLKAVGERLRQSLSHHSVIARHGGDEFIILIDAVIDYDDVVVNHAERVLELLNRPFIIENHHISVTPSIGISIYPDDAKTPKELMKNADLALYRVKYNGKNHYRIYTSLSEAKSFRKLMIEKDIHNVIRENQLEIYFQVQVKTTSGKIIGMEALVRWNHPELGVIPPVEFVPIAEATGMIFAINEWVLEGACIQQKMWENMGYDMRISVNISPQQFYYEPDVVALVKNLVTVHNLKPEKLVIEITETLAINNIDIAVKKLLDLKQFGIQIALDDFGTGYSSLSYLTRLPIDEIKIAKEFIDKLDESHANQAILSSLIALANDLNLSVVVEGVEKQEQLNQLMNLNCHLLQGYLFSKPLPLKEVNQLIIKNAHHNIINSLKTTAN